MQERIDRPSSLRSLSRRALVKQAVRLLPLSSSLLFSGSAFSSFPVVDKEIESTSSDAVFEKLPASLLSRARRWQVPAESILIDIRDLANDRVLFRYRASVPHAPASTLKNAEELAEKLGVPAPTLRKTIEEFNASVKDGKALGAAPPKKALAAALNADGPLYAFSPLTPSITMVYGGVVIDKEARVLEPDERVIRGLFAAGETVNLYYQDYHGGGILAQCLAFGRLAGEGAAAAAKKAMS